MKTWPFLLCTCLLLSGCRKEQITAPAQTAPVQAEHLIPLGPAIFTTGIAAQCEAAIRSDMQRYAAALEKIRQIDDKQSADETARQLDKLFPQNDEQTPDPDIATLPLKQELALDDAYYHPWMQTANQWETLLETLKQHRYHHSATLEKALEHIKAPNADNYLLNAYLLHNLRSRLQLRHLAAIAATPDCLIRLQTEKDFERIDCILNNISDRTSADAAAPALLDWKNKKQATWRRMDDERRDQNARSDILRRHQQQEPAYHQHKKHFVRQHYYGSAALRQAFDDTGSVLTIRQAQTSLRDDLQTLIDNIRQVHDHDSAAACALLIHQFIDKVIQDNYRFRDIKELPAAYSVNMHTKTAMLLAPLFETFFQQNDRLQALQYFGSGALEKTMSTDYIYLPFWGLGNYYTYGEDSISYLLTPHIRVMCRFEKDPRQEQPSTTPGADAAAYAEAYEGITSINNRLNSLLDTITDEQTAAAALPRVKNLVDQIETAYTQARPALAAATHCTHILHTPIRYNQELASLDTFLAICLLEAEEYHLSPELKQTLQRLKQTSTREAARHHKQTVEHLRRLNATLANIHHKTSADEAVDQIRQFIWQADAYADITAILGTPERIPSPDDIEPLIDQYNTLKENIEQQQFFKSEQLRHAFLRLDRIRAHQ